MFTVYAADGVQNILSQPDTFLRFSWIIAIVGFLVLFSYSLFKYRNVSPALKYSVSLVSAFIMFVGVYSLTQFFNPTQQPNVEATQSVEPHALTMQQINPDTVEMVWYTDKPTAQIVRYKDSTGAEQVATEQEPTDTVGTPKYKHIVIINNLASGETYSFVIYNGDTAFATYQNNPILFTIK